MRWNPFAPKPGPEPPPPVAAHPVSPPDSREGPPRNDGVAALIRAAREAAPFGDTRPLHRAILNGNFLVPTHAPARTVPDGRTGLRPVEFYKDDRPSLVAFTDEETLREVMAREERPECDWAALYGPALCRLAVEGEFARLVLNINAEDNYVMFPLTFGTLADGFVPATLDSVSEHAGEPVRLLVQEVPSPARRPPPELGDALRAAVPEAREIVWFESGWPPDELAFNVALNVSPERARELYGTVQNAWIPHWPLPTPLGVHSLDLGGGALRSQGVPI